jgi:8-oxo-dGTP pyrophosphatase MutT (NUDIX family)/phosphohistidine phosphatase SixA
VNEPEIFAAGAVLWRRGEREVELALVHRPKYDDWSFPKGKLKKGEHRLEAARREVFEETGVRPVLGRPLSPSFYEKKGRLKRVDYWCATGETDSAEQAVNPSEVDDLEWVPLSGAAERLTHERDQPVLAEFAELGARETVPFVFVRHAVAMSKSDWFFQDELRPLNQLGLERASRLRALLSSYPAGAAYAATSARCLATLLPYCASNGVPLTGLPEFTGGKPAAAERRIDRLIEEGRPAVVCGHGEAIDELAAYFCSRMRAAAPEDGALSKGSFRVFHLAEGRIVASEHHD